MPNSGDKSLVNAIRADVKNFLQFMFPVASEFEMELSTTARQNFGHCIAWAIGFLMLSVISWMVIRRLYYLIRNCRWSRIVLFPRKIYRNRDRIEF